MSVRTPSLPPSLLVRVVCTALAIGLAGCVLTISLADVLSGRRPGFSVMLDGGQTAARMRLAQEALDSEPPDLEAARAQAVEAIARDPLAPGALTVLGMVAEEASDVAAAEQLMKLAAQVSSRDFMAHGWMLARDMRAADATAAVARLDLILRITPPAAHQNLLPVVAPLFDADEFIPQLASLLGQGPVWREGLLLHLIQRKNNTKALWELVTRLQAGPVPPSVEEFAPYLARLVNEGWIEQAYAAWLAYTPAERLSSAGLLYNARFQYPVDNVPFDWMVTKSAGVVVRYDGPRRSRVVNVDFFGSRISNAVFSHLLMLPPGEYRLSGNERAQSLRTDRGLRWRLYCLEDAETPIAVTSGLRGEEPWRAFAVDFTIPENCRAQNLQMEHPARGAVESEIAGSASFTGMAIESR